MAGTNWNSGKRPSRPGRISLYTEKPHRYPKRQQTQSGVDVHDLFNKIGDITLDRENFIPFEVRDDVRRLFPRAKDRWFCSEATVGNVPSQPGREPRRSRRPLTMAEATLHELDALTDIEAEAKECQNRGRSEAAWNMLVHTPLLRYALSRHPTVRIEPATTAKIAVPFVPTTGGRGGGSVIESKMIHFVLVLWLNDGEPRLESGADVPTPDARLMSAIAEEVWQQPSDSQTVNQTTYPPLQFSPIASNLETKILTSSQDGHLQLSVWIAAWYKRIKAFVPQGQEQKRIITIPLLHAVGHDWRMSFACDRGDWIEVIGEHAIGDTRTLLGLYTLVAVLKELADWIATSYRGWIESIFLPELS